MFRIEYLTQSKYFSRRNIYVRPGFKAGAEKRFQHKLSKIYSGLLIKLVLVKLAIVTGITDNDKILKNKVGKA